MSATRPYRLVALLTLSMAALLVPAPAAPAQAQIKPAAPTAKVKVQPKAAELAKVAEPIDLNSATADQLATLPGIGDAYARRIIEGRPHKAVADLAKSGIPSTTVDKLGPMVVVRPLPAAVDVNEDPADKLQTLPGVGPALAREIIAGRPYSKYDDLAKVKGIGPAKLDDLRGRLKFGKPAAEPKAKAKKSAEAAPARPAPGEPATPAVASRERSGRSAPVAEGPKLPPGTRVNLNTATKDQLDELPGIGPAHAQAIVEARPFSSIEDVMRVKGIKQDQFGKIKDRITVK